MINIERRLWKLFVTEGVMMILLGGSAIALPGVTALNIGNLFCPIFLTYGLGMILIAIQEREAPGFVLCLFEGILSVILAVLLLVDPRTSAFALPMLLSTYMAAEIVIKWGLSFQFREIPRWGWFFFSGATSLILSALIFAGVMDMAPWLPGFMVGINMMIFGLAFLFIGFAFQAQAGE